MSDPLDAALNGVAPADMRAELAALLRLDDVGIRAIRLLGNGPSAGVEIDLSNELTIVSERFGDLWNHAGLAKFVTQNTGIVASGITKKEAEEANGLIRQLAHVSREDRLADHGRDHGLTFLRHAPVEPFWLHQQDDRYRAFSKVEACNPAAAGWNDHENRQVSAAELSLVLQDRQSAIRYVHCGHLFTDVHRRNEVSHPSDLARMMTLAGWERSGKRGRIKATPKAPGSVPIVLPLWQVPKGWDDGDDEPPNDGDSGA